MSCSIGVNLLPFKKGVDFSEVKAYATEITKKVSLEQLGYDITDPANNPEEEFQSFSIHNDALCWDDFSGCVKHPDISAIVDQIVHRFPDVEFVYRLFHEGPMVKEEYIKGDIREKLESRSLGIGIDKPEAFRDVQKKMPQGQQFGPFLMFSFPSFPVSKFYQVSEGLMQKVTRIIPGTPLYCVIFNEDPEPFLLEKGIYSGGKITWEKLTDYEKRIVSRELWIYYPEDATETLLEFLFKGLEIEIEDAKPVEPEEGEDDGGLPW